MMAQSKCPKTRHFHVSAKDVFETNSFNKVIEANDPNAALAIIIRELDNKWEGSIEVCDDQTLSPNSMPLIDFWRSPTKI